MRIGELGKTYHRGEIIFKEGDKGDVMYVIQEGSVRISRQNGAEEVQIAVLGPGEILGEMALFDLHTRSATATVEAEARILTIDKQKLFATISREPTLAFNIIETLSRRIRKLNEELRMLTASKG